MYVNNFYLDSSPNHVSLDKLSAFDDYAQIMAIWSDSKIADDTAFFAFHKIADYLNFEVERLDGEITYVKTKEQFKRETNKKKILLSVEDARILCGRLDRLTVLHARGVRFLIPVWGGSSIIGGAHDTSEGLTEFGKSVIEECHKLGIITDVSHASEKTAEEMFDAAEKAGKSVMASHSNAYAVCPHSRNLKNGQIEQIKRLGGVIGISMHTPHLSTESTAHTDDVIKHIEHYMSFGCENAVALGCDFDGTDRLPEELRSVADLHKLAESLARLNYSDGQIDKIFFANAKNFTDKNL